MNAPILHATRDDSPVAIGGVGGSGTRLIARMLLELGRDMGTDLNDSLDNLWFTLLFKRREWLDPATQGDFTRAARLFGNIMAGGVPLDLDEAALVERLAREERLQHPQWWLHDRAASLLAAAGKRPAGKSWGWKEPNTHVFLQQLLSHWPTMRYIHVMRHGMDMAMSANQNQLMLWGSQFLGKSITAAIPRLALAYWCEVHRRVLRTGEAMRNRFLLINYDKFCARPREGLQELLDFLECPAERAELDRLAGLVRLPESIGRYRHLDPGAFEPADMAYVRTLGFEVDFAKPDSRQAVAHIHPGRTP